MPTSSPNPSWSETQGAAPTQRLRRRKHVDDTEMDITPMIDITFLLLIFFVVASKMDQSTTVALPEAQFGVAVPTKNSVIVTIAAGGGGQPPAIYKGDGVNAVDRIEYNDLGELESQLEEYVSESMFEDTRKHFVLIKAAGTIQHRDVSRVTQVVSRVPEVQGLHVAVLEEQ
jgi:biopolymer transport protein ExbD